jgi:biofilm PGA synthesis N-glycosyltransferase PgaC
MVILFWFSLIIGLYVYIGYPAILKLSSVLRSNNNKTSNELSDFNHTMYKSVTIVLSMYNEEDCIEQKIENMIGLNYPKDKLEFILASDNSNDRTNEIVEKYLNHENIKFFPFSERNGKNAILNRIIPKARGEIIVFTDANTMFDSDAIIQLTKHFFNEKIGGVCGDLIFVDGIKKSNVYAESKYWDYEKMLKMAENATGSVCVSNGAIYAVRKHLLDELDLRVGDDFQNPPRIMRKGFRFIYEPKALAYESISHDDVAEHNRKVRIATRSLTGIFSNIEMLNIIKYPDYAFKIISHKLLRYSIPIWLIIVYISNIFLLGHAFYNTFFAIQTLSYLLAIIGWILVRLNKKPNKIFYIPFYFCLVNFAALKAWYRLCTNRHISHWQPPEHNQVDEG